MLLLALVAALAAAGPGASEVLSLPVPVVRQAPERCGPAALAMALRYYGADSVALADVESAYDPVLRGALITDLAAVARRAGFEARVATPGSDSLLGLLRAGVPPVLLYRRGWGPVTRGHYGVLVGWDPIRSCYAVNDGGAKPRQFHRRDLLRRWEAAGGQALIVQRREP